ncbi:MAG TPA: thioredoxin domain-containing protein [Baekduia sp.]|uniref:DsbA family protein n=1 Tax=Baekduia sp. TaxID=2600305 RepID=UPI002C1DBAD7|nr:thioredoxin domain-containing protein [Baekduia sp.]HMJ35554.1 thioredoxin domain-containing protein [Baekduia sp.]
MTRRLAVLATLFGGAAAIVAVAIAISSGGADPQRRTPAARDVTSIVRGIPQNGLVLGDPRAPVLLVEFADAQCPFCREFAVKTWPAIVQKYVRTGKVRMELRLVDFLGKDSTRAARALLGAGQQNRMWDASARFYDVQGAENSGYVTDQFLRDVLGGVDGLDVDQVMVDRHGSRVAEELGAVKSMQSRYGVTATPTLLIGSDDGDLHVFTDGVVSPQQLGQALDAALLEHI